LDSHWLDFGLSCLLCLIAWLGLFGLKGLLRARWKEAIAITATTGFVTFLGYLLLQALAPHFGVTPSRWMIVPLVVIVVWLYHDMLFLRSRQQ
jgi:hypothetical protein